MCRSELMKCRHSSVLGVRFSLVLLVCLSLLPVLLSAGCLSEEEMIVKVRCSGSWTGVVEQDDSAVTISGSGTKSYSVACSYVEVSVNTLAGSDSRSITVSILDEAGEEMARDYSSSGQASVSAGDGDAKQDAAVCFICSGVFFFFVIFGVMSHITNSVTTRPHTATYQPRPRSHQRQSSPSQSSSPPRSSTTPTKLPGGYEIVGKDGSEISWSDPVYLKGGGHHDTRMVYKTGPATLERGPGNSLIRKQRGLEVVEVNWKTKSANEKIRAVVSWEHLKVQKTTPRTMLPSSKEEAEDAGICEACSSLVLESSKFCWHCGGRME